MKIGSPFFNIANVLLKPLMLLFCFFETYLIFFLSVFAATPAAAPQQGACNTPTDGTAVITATTNLGITSSGTAGTCILKVVNNNVGKKVTLTLPASFGVSFTHSEKFTFFPV